MQTDPKRYFSRIFFVSRFSQIEKLLFISMRTRTDCQIDFLQFKILPTDRLVTVQDRLLLFKILPTDRLVTVQDRLLLFKIDFYYSRFYRQINLSSLHLTQVTYEDLPWFSLSINRQTSKTEDRSRF